MPTGRILTASRWVLALGILALGLMSQAASAQRNRACGSEGGKCKSDTECCDGVVCAPAGLCKRGCKIRVPITNADEDEDGDGVSDAPLFYENGDINPDNDCQWCQSAVDRFGWTNRASGEACGSDADTECTDPDTCDGSGTCLPNHEPDTALCGDAGTECTNPDYCDGSGGCTDNGFQSDTTPCTDSDETDCYAAECDGEGQCDQQGGLEAQGYACGSQSDTDCDNPNTCDATGICLNNHEPATTPCTDSDPTDCYAAECDGAGQCDQQGGLEAQGYACGSQSDTVCDNPNECDANGTCLEMYEPTSTPCRSAAGDCDVAEFCDGAGSCPQDRLKESGTECRPVAGVCDVAEVCDGTSGSCPEDEFVTVKSSVDNATAATPGSAPGVYVCSGHSATPCDVACKTAAVTGDCGEIMMACGEVKNCPPCAGSSPPEATSNVAAFNDGTGVGGTASSFSYYWSDGCGPVRSATICEGYHDPYRCCTGAGEGSCHDICLPAAGYRCEGDADCATGWCECYGVKDGATNTCDSSGGMCRLPRITANCYFDAQCDAGIELHDSGARCREIGDTGLSNCQPLPGQTGEACEFPWVVLANYDFACAGGTRLGQACSASNYNPTTGCPGCEGGACGGAVIRGGCLPAKFCYSSDGTSSGLFCRSDSDCPGCTSGGCCLQPPLPHIYCFEKMACAGGTRNGAICSTIQLRADGTADPDKGCPGCEDGSCGANYGCNLDLDWEQLSASQCESGLCGRNAVATGGPLVTDGSVCCRDLGEACESDSDCCKGSATLCLSANPTDGEVEGYTLDDLRIRRCVATGADDPTGLFGKVCKRVSLLGEPCTTDADCWGPFDIVCTPFSDGSGGVCTSYTYTPRPQGASCSSIGDTAANPQQSTNVPTKFFTCQEGLECRDCTGKENGWRCAPPQKICVGGDNAGKACGNPKYVCDGGIRDRETCVPGNDTVACPKAASTDPQPTCKCFSGCADCTAGGGTCQDNPYPGCCSSGSTFALGGQDFDLSNPSDPGECPDLTNPRDVGRCCNFGCAYLRTDPDNCGSCGNRCSVPANNLEGGPVCWEADDTTTCSEYKCNYEFKCEENQVCGGANSDGSPICRTPVIIAGTGIQVGELALFAYASATGQFDQLAIDSDQSCDEDSDCANEYFCQKSCVLSPEFKNAPPPNACTDVKGVCTFVGRCGDGICDDPTETEYKYSTTKTYCYEDCGHKTFDGDGHCEFGETCYSSIIGVGTCDCGRCTIFDDPCD